MEKVIPPINFYYKKRRPKTRISKSNPRSKGTNPRSKSTNPRSNIVDVGSKEAADQNGITRQIY